VLLFCPMLIKKALAKVLPSKAFVPLGEFPRIL